MAWSKKISKGVPQQHQPATPPSTPSGSFAWILRAVGAAIVAIAVGVSANVLLEDLLPGWSWAGYGSSSVDWDSRRQEVKGAFISSYSAYSKYAWGQLLMIYVPRGT